MRLQYRDRKHGRDKRRPHGLRPSSSKGFIIKSSVYHWGEQCHWFKLDELGRGGAGVVGCADAPKCFYWKHFCEVCLRPDYFQLWCLLRVRNMQKKYTIVPFVLEKHHYQCQQIWGVAPSTWVLNIRDWLLQTSSRWVAQVRKWKPCPGVDTGESTTLTQTVTGYYQSLMAGSP